MKRRTLVTALVSGAVIAPTLNMARAEAKSREPVRQPPRKGPFVTTRDGTKLFVRDRGSGPAVVLTAPWALGADWFEYQTAGLTSGGARCITYDRRGHGRSDEPAYGYDFDTLADDLAAVIAHCGLKDFVLAGHSMGSGEVVRYMSRHAGRGVRHLVLVAPITPFILQTDDNPAGIPAAALEAGRTKLAGDRPGQIAKSVDDFFAAQLNDTSAPVKQWWIDLMLRSSSLQVMLDLQRVFTATDFRPDLKTIAIPTTIIQGDNDKSTPLDFTGRRTAALIPNSRLSVYEKAAHALPVTHFARLNAELLEIARS